MAGSPLLGRPGTRNSGEPVARSWAGNPLGSAFHFTAPFQVVQAPCHLALLPSLRSFVACGFCSRKTTR